jgi:protein-tyrosine phosphatase
MNGKTSVLFVCMGNICRSPTAEGVFQAKVQAAGLEAWVAIDSAGTHAYHVGKPPDPRAQAAAAGRGLDLSAQRARQVAERDFSRFDYILAMDRDNLAGLLSRCPEEHRHKLRLYLDFSRRYTGQDVPDPYYGGHQGFETVLDMVSDAADGLLEHLTRSQPRDK